MSNSLVSIIMPCYNAEGFVSEAIESAVNQSYPFKEVIVIDDGSTDGSLSVIKKFGRKIRWETGPNKGGSAARNRGLSLAKGDYIQFHDTDDLLDLNKLETQMPILLQTGADLVYSDWRQYNIARPERKWICHVVPQGNDPVVLALQKQNITTNAPIHKKETLLKINGFREDLPCCQERDLHLRLACSGVRFHYLPGVLHTVRERLNSVSYNELCVRNWLYKLIVDTYDMLAQENELNDERKEAFATLLSSSARRVLRLGQRDRAMEQFSTACKMHPKGGLPGAYSRFGYFLARATGPAIAEAILMRAKKISSILYR